MCSGSSSLVLAALSALIVLGVAVAGTVLSLPAG